MRRSSGIFTPRLCLPTLFLLFSSLFLISCGGASNSGNGSSTQPPPTSGQFTHVYAAFPPNSGVDNTHFVQTVMPQPAIEGVSVHNSWNDVETTAPGANTCSPVGTDTCQMDASGWTHSYDWSTIDGNNSQWFQYAGNSKKVNIILQGTNSVGSTCLILDTCVNASTPYYVTSPPWTSHIGSHLDLINGNKDGCSLWVGLFASMMTRDANGLVTVVENHHGYNDGDMIWVGESTPNNFNLLIASVTNVHLVSATQTLTVTADNNFPVGMEVMFLKLGNATFLNGQTVTVTAASSTQFTAKFEGADYGPAAENGGVAEPQGVPVLNATENTFQFQSGTKATGSASIPGTIISAKQSWPVVYESPYKTAWEAFVAAAIAHFNNIPTRSQIVYMRVGRGAGGEAFPYCVDTLQSLPAPNTYTKDLWLQYYTDIDDFVEAQKPLFQIMDPMNQAGDPLDSTYGEAEAQIAVAHQNANGTINGFGTQGLQSSDIANYAKSPDDCDSDWCAMFNTYYTAGYPLALQQLSLSDPTGVLNPGTGDLRPLLPFAVERHMKILELYALDALLAYDPNYCVIANPDNGFCAAGSVEIPPTTLPPQDQEPYFQLVGQPGQPAAKGDGSYATVINQTQGQH
jgi:hypothetical protein